MARCSTGGPYLVGLTGRFSGSPLGFQGLFTRREAYRRVVETDSHSGWGGRVGRRVHV